MLRDEGEERTVYRTIYFENAGDDSSGDSVYYLEQSAYTGSLGDWSDFGDDAFLNDYYDYSYGDDYISFDGADYNLYIDLDTTYISSYYYDDLGEEVFLPYSYIVTKIVEFGDGADDIFYGSGCIDVMTGLSGDDTYYVDDSDDVVVEAIGQGDDIVITEVSYVLDGGDEIETLQLAKKTGSKALNLTGNAFANALRGNDGANVLDGKGGADTLQGGKGNDTYIVDNAGDRVIEAAGAGKDTIITTVTYALGRGQEVETLRFADSVGTANLDLSGNETANRLFGNAGNNGLDGGAGNDLLAGKLGADTLTGRAGSDTFVFDTKLGKGNVDHITDFSHAADTIQLENSVFHALMTGELGKSAFKDIAVLGAKIDANDRIIYNHDTGVLRYDADGSGKGQAVTFAVLDHHAKLDHTDFLIV